LGWANGGSLDHGRQLIEGESIRFLPGRTLHWGTDELLGLLERVGDSLKTRFRSKLTVGDLSAQHGGPVGRHRSHQSGRDADLCFLARIWNSRNNGAPTDLNNYISFGANGRSLDGRYVFDTARNWALLEALLGDRRVSVDHIFISNPLRTRLLTWAREHDADPALLRRASLLMFQPRRVSPHDNHFHVRIACPEGDAQCRGGILRPRVIRRRPAKPRHLVARSTAVPHSTSASRSGSAHHAEPPSHRH
jgi:penicillin-insensitive murein DD-endopeptidase